MVYLTVLSKEFASINKRYYEAHEKLLMLLWGLDSVSFTEDIALFFMNLNRYSSVKHRHFFSQE